MSIPLSILFIDDCSEDVELLHEHIKAAGYGIEFERVDSDADLRTALIAREWNVILCDFAMPGFGGVSALEIVNELNPTTPFIFVSGVIGEEIAVEAMRSGAQDYVMKDNLRRLIPAIERSLREVMVKRDRNRLHRRLNFLAYHDPLTGLPNRVLFINRLRLAIDRAHRYQRRLAVGFLDLDRFKLINDTLGHDAGDQLLREVAARLQRSVRKIDIVSRLAGDEFAIVLTDLVSNQDIARIMNEINHELSQPINIAGQVVYAKASVGISTYPDDGTEPGALLQCADTAMYCAKQQGGGLQFYSAALTAQAKEQLRVETGLRRAIETDGFAIHYQPLVNMENNHISGVEALVRWPNNGRLEMPAEFIPLAEKTGLIVPIGAWVLKNACRDCQDWRIAGYLEMRVAVNLSVRQFQDSKLPETVQQVLDDAGLDSSALELEITESVLMKNDTMTKSILHRLRDMGVTLSIDDFGTGYSSLGYLRHLPINVLKIDRSFTQNLLSQSNDRAIVKVIISMAKCLNFKVTAEGVESQEQLDVVRNEGCDMAQGNFISPPMELIAIAPWMQRRYDAHLAGY